MNDSRFCCAIQGVYARPEGGPNNAEASEAQPHVRQSDGGSYMDMPKPGAAHARLHTLAGRWQGGENMHPAPWDPVGGTATALVENRIALTASPSCRSMSSTAPARPTSAGMGCSGGTGRRTSTS